MRCATSSKVRMKSYFFYESHKYIIDRLLLLLYWPGQLTGFTPYLAMDSLFGFFLGRELTTTEVEAATFLPVCLPKQVKDLFLMVKDHKDRHFPMKEVFSPSIARWRYCTLREHSLYRAPVSTVLKYMNCKHRIPLREP